MPERQSPHFGTDSAREMHLNKLLDNAEERLKRFLVEDEALNNLCVEAVGHRWPEPESDEDLAEEQEAIFYDRLALVHSALLGRVIASMSI